MPRDTCFFDGRCGFCRRSTRILRALDWLHNLDFQDLTLLPVDQLPCPIEDAMRGMPMRTAGGRVLLGFRAIRRALLRTPPGCLPALLMYLPGVSHAGALVYNHIARNRARDACAVSPAPPAQVEPPARFGHT